VLPYIFVMMGGMRGEVLDKYNYFLKKIRPLRISTGPLPLLLRFLPLELATLDLS
jgi:hypothetical protein